METEMEMKMEIEMTLKMGGLERFLIWESNLSQN